MASTFANIQERLQSAAQSIDSHLQQDRSYPELIELLGLVATGHATTSGASELDYPSLASPNIGLAQLPLISNVKKVPLPNELVEQFGHMQCNCMMGIFAEIGRAWLTIDSDIFVWSYEDGGDLAYFDGLNETILSVGLVKPKPNVFQRHIRYLLCLTTPVDIVLLGVSFSQPQQGSMDAHSLGEMHLLPEPLFSIPTDNIYMMQIVGTDNGRILMAGKDGCLYELVYQAEDGWFSRKCRKINHSTSKLSFLVPSFLSFTFSEDDSIVQIAVDNTRHVVYTRSEKGSLQVYDLGSDGISMSRVTAISQQSIVHNAALTARTIERSNFKPIVSIAAIPRTESTNVHLVAITQTGVRLYFTTTHFNKPLARPSMLTLVHVRLPPGFTTTAAPQRPTHVHKAYHRKGTLLLCSSLNEDTDSVWCISPDSFPFQRPLIETQINTTIESHTWALDEVPAILPRLVQQGQPEQLPEPPAVVVQHMLPHRRFVLLSSQGSHLFNVLSPAEQLRQLLLENGGPDNPDVEAFFKLHKEDHACATCLVLACSKSAIDPQIRDWATRAFITFGGEPQHQSEMPVSSSTMTQQFGTSTPSVSGLGTSVLPTPAAASTPAVGAFQQTTEAMTPQPHFQTQQQQSQMMAPGTIPEIIYSGRFRGLCLYFCRLLRPLWDQFLVKDVQFTTQAGPQNILESRFSGDAVSWFFTHLESLKDFMEKNSQFTALAESLAGVGPFAMTRQDTIPGARASRQMLQKQRAEAEAAEKMALISLQYLVQYSCQVLALWKVVSDHQFHIITSQLDKNTQNQLRQMKFCDLVTSGKELCSALITALINRYLGDNATTDAISSKLREVCPLLYSTEDAIVSKANELLQTAKQTSNRFEKEEMLKKSLQLFSEVSHQLNLQAVCAEYQAVGFFEGIVELSLTAAHRRDQQGLALHYYRSGEPPEDTQGMQAFVIRLDCYKCVHETLAHLVDVSQAYPQSPGVPRRPGPPTISTEASRLSAQEATHHMDEMMRIGLKSNDELFHVALYDWLVNMRLTDKLLEISSPYVEGYLKRAAAYQPDNLEMLDLMWKYYEKIRNFSAAAKILAKLADRHGTDVGLPQRIEYISRAIMTAKSSTLRTSSASDGEFLHELEEKMEVARIQLKIFEAISNFHSSQPEIQNALSQLNAELMDITRLYAEFAEPFQLWESQLAIIHCASHYDPALVESLWENIIKQDLEDTFGKSASTRIASLSDKIISLGRIYITSDRYFPLDFLVKHLEKKTCQLDWDKSWVFRTFMKIGIQLTTLHHIYDSLFKAKDSFWHSVNKPLHVLDAIYLLLTLFTDNPSKVPAHERRAFTSRCLDAIASYNVELEAMGLQANVQTTLAKFKELQARLDRLHLHTAMRT
ncbi:nuclear pore complex protein Nup155-like [Ptychodera flava]|uniref:nuclear pore complex protein Nup155-like n=1 Tax=Ptychodera flava TaxID=63121 RepID=UPI003969C803